MQLPYRVSRLMPQKDETLVKSPEQARELITQLEEKLRTGRSSFRNQKYGQRKGLPRWERATNLIARATLYIALGDRKMLDAGWDAYNFSKTTQSCIVLGSCHAYYGRTEKAIDFYTQAYNLPHEAGFEADMSYVNGLILQDRWAEAWPLHLKLKKRMTYAGYLPDWRGQEVEELSIIGEGGFGDLIQTSRWIPVLQQRCKKLTYYATDYCFTSGLVDLARQQPWFCEIKRLIETPQKTWATGAFDIAAVMNITPDTVPPPIPWARTETYKYEYLHKNVQKPVVGFCWNAGEMETPLCPKGVYRALTDEQAVRIVQQTSDKINWVSLQYKAEEGPAGIHIPENENWSDAAAIVANLDAVVTVDTSVMHLAAVMGKPTWTLLSGVTDTKFGMHGSECRWYPTMRVWHNENFGFENSVESVIQTVNNNELNINA